MTPKPCADSGQKANPDVKQPTRKSPVRKCPVTGQNCCCGCREDTVQQ